MRGAGMLSAAMACALITVLPGCEASAPPSPSPVLVTLQLLYLQPDPSSLPPPGPDDGMCYHHYAPAHLMLETSWGYRGRLEQFDDRRYGLALAGVPAGHEHWLTFVDHMLCPTGTVRVTRGVWVNGVELTRTLDANSGPVVAFRLDAAGRVVP